MGTQYQSNNINSPRLPRIVDSDLQLNLDDEFIIIGSGSPTLTLPPADTIPSWQIYVKSVTGLGAVIGSNGETIDGMTLLSFSSPQEAVIIKSNGSNWSVVSGGASSAPCPALCIRGVASLLQGATEVLELHGLNIDGVVTLYNDPTIGPPPGPLPVIVSATWASGGGAPALDMMTLVLDTTLSSGNYCAAVTVNGCNALIPFTVIPI